MRAWYVRRVTRDHSCSGGSYFHAGPCFSGATPLSNCCQGHTQPSAALYHTASTSSSLPGWRKSKTSVQLACLCGPEQCPPCALFQHLFCSHGKVLVLGSSQTLPVSVNLILLFLLVDQGLSTLGHIWLRALLSQLLLLLCLRRKMWPEGAGLPWLAESPLRDRGLELHSDTLRSGISPGSTVAPAGLGRGKGGWEPQGWAEGRTLTAPLCRAPPVCPHLCSGPTCRVCLCSLYLRGVGRSWIAEACEVPGSPLRGLAVHP